MSLKHILAKRRPKKGMEGFTKILGQPALVYTRKESAQTRGGRRKPDPVTKIPKFRSGFEKEFWDKNSPLMNLKYEPYKIKYQIIREGQYLPDFVHIPREQIQDTIVFETKGRWYPKDRTKLLAVLESNPGLTVVMVFQQDNWLTKRHTQRYSDWCKKRNIPYCIGIDLTKINWIKRPKLLDDERVKKAKVVS